MLSGWTGRARDLAGSGVTRVGVTIRENIPLTNSKETFNLGCCSRGEESGSCNSTRGLQPSLQPRRLGCEWMEIRRAAVKGRGLLLKADQGDQDGGERIDQVGMVICSRDWWGVVLP